MPIKCTEKKTSNGETQKIWQQLHDHYQTIKHTPIREYFIQDPQRTQSFSLLLNGKDPEKMLFLDYGKINATKQTFSLLHELCEMRSLDRQRRKIFAGDIVNFSENKPCAHIFLRAPEKYPEVKNMLYHMLSFAQKLRTGTLDEMPNQPIQNVITIGIGGSRIGVEMATQALKKYARENVPHLYFISSIKEFENLCHQIDIRTTLFLISSKSFTTVETISTFQYIWKYVATQIGEKHTPKHFVALTSYPERAIRAGLQENRIFSFSDAVGGRFSLWGATGLPLIILLGKDIHEFHAGAYHMDMHFLHASFLHNMPVLLALIGVWHRTICKFSARAILPYDTNLHNFTDHIRQLDMESNGKTTDIYGAPIKMPSGVLTFGSDAHNAQHSFMQSLHQGYDTIPCEFILAVRDSSPMTLSHCLAQSEALMNGEKNDDLQKSCPGNRPSLTLLYSSLTPFNLGQLIALYEHRTIVEGWLWNNNPFDQWGVELGKKIAPNIENFLTGTPKTEVNMNAATRALMNIIRQFR